MVVQVVVYLHLSRCPTLFWQVFWDLIKRTPPFPSDPQRSRQVQDPLRRKGSA
jgi:hypothetical protein